MHKCLCCEAYFETAFLKANHMQTVHKVDYALTANGYGFNAEQVARANKGRVRL